MGGRAVGAVDIDGFNVGKESSLWKRILNVFIYLFGVIGALTLKFCQNSKRFIHYSFNKALYIYITHQKRHHE